MTWVKAVRALQPDKGASGPLVPSEFTKICSKHFKPEDYNQDCKQRRLLPHAVPSQFQQSTLQTHDRRFRRRRRRRPAEDVCAPSGLGAARDGRAEPVSDSGLRSTGGGAGPPVKVTTSPVVIRPLRDSSSGRDCEGQRKTGGEVGPPVRITTPVVIRPPRDCSAGRDDEAQQSTGGEAGSPFRVTTSPADTALRDNSSGPVCEGQRSTGGEAIPPVRVTTTPVVIMQYVGDSIMGLDWEGPTPAAEAGNQSKGTGVGVTHNNAANVAGNSMEAVPVAVAATSSAACQTQVSGLTIAAYEEQIKSLQKECKRLREELCELRTLQLCVET